MLGFLYESGIDKTPALFLLMSHSKWTICKAVSATGLVTFNF